MIDPLWKKKKKFTTIAAKYFHCVNNKIEPCVSLSSREKFSFNNATGHGYIQFQLQYCPFHPSISLLLSRAHRLSGKFFRYSYSQYPPLLALWSLTLPFLFLLTVLTTVIIFANEAMYTRRSIVLRILITFSKQALFLYMLYTYTHTRTHIRVLRSRTRCNTAARERK